MNLSSQILSDIAVFNKYAKYISLLNRRETWEELVDRNKKMHIDKFSSLRDEINKAYSFVYSKQILPSMRSMQFAGKPIGLNPARIYNCAYLPVDDYRAFSETMFLLLGGTGVGYSVQNHHIDKLLPIYQPQKSRRYLIGDSIEGWADSIKALFKAFMFNKSLPRFDFSDIREKGARLVTAGGKAPGPEPLKECLFQLEKILTRKQNGTKLSSLECHDILCHIADAVLAGGIRRAAMISFFDFDDELMLSAKTLSWHELEPQRGRANNSAVILRHRIKKQEFFEFWQRIRLSNCGEPGVFLTYDKDVLSNPCCEISLKPFQFCNLVEVNVSDIQSQEDLNLRVEHATFIATLQASYTDFHYLRAVWQRTTERDALIGVGMTGIASGKICDFDLREAAQVVKDENARVADIIGINHAARCTTVKPSGTSSIVLGTSSGIHAWHDDYYIRRLRLNKDEPLYLYLQAQFPELVEDEYHRPHQQAVLSVPQKAPRGSCTRFENSLSLLARIKHFHDTWIKTGHRAGANTHNVSATISVRNDEWEEVGQWMWENRDAYNGLAVLPHDGSIYAQMPFESCSKGTYEKMMTYLSKINLSEIYESKDDTSVANELACAGGSCELS